MKLAKRLISLMSIALLVFVATAMAVPPPDTETLTVNVPVPKAVDLGFDTNTISITPLVGGTSASSAVITQVKANQDGWSLKFRANQLKNGVTNFNPSRGANEGTSMDFNVNGGAWQDVIQDNALATPTDHVVVASGSKNTTPNGTQNNTVNYRVDTDWDTRADLTYSATHIYTLTF